MALQIARALSGGVRRVATSSGLVVLLLTVVSQLALVSAVNTVVTNTLPADIHPRNIGAIGFSLPVSTDAAAFLGVASLLVTVGIALVATRLLSRDLATLNSVPVHLATRRFGRTFLSTTVASVGLAGSLLVGFFVLSVAVPFGAVLFAMLGVVLVANLQFAIFAIAVEDAGALGSLQRSWKLTQADRLQVVALAVVLILINGVLSVLTAPILLAAPIVGQIFSVFATSAFLVVLYGVLADAYLQLRGGLTNRSDAL